MQNFDPHTHAELSRHYHAAHERRDEIHRKRVAGVTGLAGELTLVNREIRELAEQLGLVRRAAA